MQNKTILLVEDDCIIAADVEVQLQGLGYEVVHVPNGTAALRWLSGHLATLVLLNFQQPHHLDGMGVARLIRSRFLTPTLVMTGARKEELIQSPDFYAGQSYLLKPFTQLQLIEAVGALLKGRSVP